MHISPSIVLFANSIPELLDDDNLKLMPFKEYDRNAPKLKSQTMF
ncbi:MAG: hypothetical protein RLZZ210_1024 [Pseudomonadota bacterium]|jgi:hypothetical protein